MLEDIVLPEAVYGCANEDCAAEVSYPADMLYWWGGAGPGSTVGSQKAVFPSYWTPTMEIGTTRRLAATQTAWWARRSKRT